MKVMDAFDVSKARVDQLLCGTLSPVYADNSVLQEDIIVIMERYGHLSHWAEQLGRAQRLLTHKITREAHERVRAEINAQTRAALASYESRVARERAKRNRHTTNLNNRRATQRLEAAGAGCGKKQG